MASSRSATTGPRRHRVPAALAVSLGVALVSGASAAASPVTVTLAFDDGMGTRNDPAKILAPTGTPATFYVNTVTVQKATDDSAANDEHLSWDQLAALHAAGHEIGGHTLHHTRLTPPDHSPPVELPGGDPEPAIDGEGGAGSPDAPNPALTPTDEELRAEVCDDRETLREHGYAARSFAYPFGRTDARASAVVRGCGYLTGRTTSAPEIAASLPPVDPYATEAFNTGGMTGEQLLGYVRRAVAGGGGWVQFVFHDVCDTDDTLCKGTPEESVTPRALRTLAAGLATEPQVRVKTAGDVVGADAEAEAPVFPTLAPGTTADRAVVVRNDGLAALELGEAALGGPRGPFRVTTDACSGRTVAPGASCAVAVRFAPATDGTFAGRLRLRGNTEPETTLVPFTATATTPTTNPGGEPGGPGGGPGGTPGGDGGTPDGGGGPGSGAAGEGATDGGTTGEGPASDGPDGGALGGSPGPDMPPAPGAPAAPGLPPAADPGAAARAAALRTRTRLLRARRTAYRACSWKSTRKARVACRARVRVRYGRLLRRVPAVPAAAVRR
jgi:peptidoglycan/xylan/chitin deacetylase (PgdA/CDA1 family)